MAQRSLNKVLLLGHLGRDPELRYTAAGKAVATFTVATSLQWKDQSGNDQDKTEWHRVVAWGRLGEVCGEYLSKGKQVFIEGRIQTREWEDQDGNKRTTVEIIANDMIMLGGGSQSQNRGTQEPPRRQAPPSARPAAPAGKKSDDYYPPPPEDDIPF
ncbi:MAG: single-stranded DNA-binding protein [Desulfomonile tiedjei]|uniref:Single-stranded DNA-binding protein n=1 Tax=Desulfomonile tiedjei TaxID=2358 RepID=A0A9D6V1R3_9BACT|nr:single-stranded DNA-binding protein [Desulfomonile tiedjei]